MANDLNIPEFYANDVQVKNTVHDLEIRFLLRDSEKALKGAINIRLPSLIAEDLIKDISSALSKRK